MSRLPKLNPTKLNPSLVEEASDWFIEFSEDTLGVTRREQFDAWLRRSPEHVQAYLKIAMVWEETPLLGKTRVLPSDELVARVLAQGNIVSLTKPQPDSERSALASSSVTRYESTKSAPGLRRRILVAAASLLIAVAVGRALYIQRQTYSTGVGEQRSVRLEDGSTVDLNSQSKIRVRFTDQRRTLELLEGQALFRVAKDAARPFIVNTDDTHVRAVGTQFDVYRKNNGTVVTVLEGRVAVVPEVAPSIPAADSRPASSSGNPAIDKAAKLPSTQSTKLGALLIQSKPQRPASSAHPGSPALATQAATPAPRTGEVLLGAGEQITVTPGAISAPHEANLSLATAWTQRKIAFKATPLSEVVDEFNRYNSQQLEIMDPDLKSTKVSGVFSSTDPEALLKFLRGLPNISMDESGDRIRIATR